MKTKTTIEIETSDGITEIYFEIISDGEIEIGRTKNCSVADSDGDYLLGNELLIRIQKEET